MPNATNANEPYCANCGYILAGLTDSARCPECGKPLVEVLARPSFGPRGKRYQSKARIFGWPVISVAIGPDGQEKRGHARGLIAIGDFATGGIALGGITWGIVSAGGMAVGVCAVGGLSVGLLSAFGGLAISGAVAVGGCAVGIIAVGGAAFGIFAEGGGAIGWYTRDGSGVAGAAMFDHYQRLLGPWRPKNVLQVLQLLRPLFIGALLTLLTSALIGVIALMRLNSEPEESSVDHGRDASIRR